MRRERITAALLLLAVVAVWGATFPLVKRALQDCTPLLFNQLRMLLAAGVLAVVHIREWRRMSRRSVVTGAVAGFFLAAGYEFQTAGLALTTPSKSAFLTGMIVIFVPILAMLPGIRTRGATLRIPRTLSAAVIAFAGILLLTIPAGTPARDLYSVINRGDVLTLICALAFACHLLTLSKASHDIPLAQLATTADYFLRVVYVAHDAACGTRVAPVEFRSCSDARYLRSLCDCGGVQHSVMGATPSACVADGTASLTGTGVCVDCFRQLFRRTPERTFPDRRCVDFCCDSFDGDWHVTYCA